MPLERRSCCVLRAALLAACLIVWQYWPDPGRDFFSLITTSSRLVAAVLDDPPHPLVNFFLESPLRKLGLGRARPNPSSTSSTATRFANALRESCPPPQGVQLHDPSSSILSSSIFPYGSHPRPSIAFDWGFYLVISTSARVSISASFDLPR